MDEPSWQDRLEVWLEPFLERLGHKAQRRWAPVYLHGLLGPGDRKSLEPMAERVAPGEAQQLHHFIATSPWSTAPLEEELVQQADALLGGPDAVLVIDDTPLIKQGRHSVGIALEEIDRVRAAGARFGWVVADAEYGKAAAFRHGLQDRKVRWAVGILSTQKVYPADVTLTAAPAKRTGRPPKHPLPSLESRSVADTVAALPEDAFHSVTWRQGTKGALAVDFVAQRVRVADGPPMRDGQHLPGQLAWLVCERRAEGERKYYLANHPDDTPLQTLAGHIKARWVCEQVHQQIKE